MKYKMLVMDMDGTLLTNDKRISERNKEALDKAAKTGVILVVSTGRIFTSARVFGEMIGVSSPIIASNGAYIREKDRDEVVYAMLLGEKAIRDVLAACKKHNLVCHFMSSNTIYTEKLIYASLNYSKWNNAMPGDRQVHIQIVNENEWDEVIRKNSPHILKAVIADENPDKIAALRADIEVLDVEVVSSAKNNIEIMNKGVSKGKAVQVLADYFNLKRDEIICIGDNENDISMIRYAGLGIAMGNATAETKSAADFVTLTNEEDGVAYIIEKFILSEQ
ncbi:Cof-type HAD-IIB family hydrolase [Oxobacter pfennigii]|nr:Cof-type HAD-IIB family hydrolase [Oxobacter pfennigii]